MGSRINESKKRKILELPDFTGSMPVGSGSSIVFQNEKRVMILQTERKLSLVTEEKLKANSRFHC